MIQGFSEQTKPLTDYEDKVILPLIVQGLHGKVGKYKAITNKAMCSALKSYGCKIDSPRIRKIINHIRLSGMVIGLSPQVKATISQKHVRSWKIT